MFVLLHIPFSLRHLFFIDLRLKADRECRNKYYMCTHSLQVTSYILLFIMSFLQIMKLNPLATGAYILKSYVRRELFVLFTKDNKIVERRLCMTIEVWHTNRLYNLSLDCLVRQITCQPVRPFNFMRNIYRRYRI